MLIYNMAVTEDERLVTKARVSSLLATYRRGSMTKEEVNRYYKEWIEVATRIHRGGMMMDEAHVVRDKSKEYLREMEDLYKLLLKVLGMYDAFFSRMYEGRYDLYERAQRNVLHVLQGKAA